MKLRAFARRAPHVCSILLSICASYADVVQLKNGDRLTGALVRKDADKLTIRSGVFGEVQIPWDAVQSVEVDKPVTVVLSDGKTLKGTLRSQGSEVRVTEGSEQVVAALGRVSAIRDEAEQRKYERLADPRLIDLWVGYFDFGLALARGNARTTTLTNAFEGLRLTPNDKIRLYFKQIYAKASIDNRSSLTANAVRGGWAYDHNITGRTFFNAFNDYENDRFQNLDLRFVLGGGAGLHAIRGERTILDLVAGGAYNRENFFNGVIRNSSEAYWGDDLSYRLNRATSITQTFRMFNNLSNTGAYRVNFDLGAATTLRRWLSFQVTASDRFLSNPVFGRQRNDILLTTGFRVSFSR